MLRSRFADEWNSWGIPTEIAHGLDLLTTACEKEDRDPATLRKSVQPMVFVVDDPDAVAKLRARVLDDRSIVGSVPEIIDQLGRYVELGIDEFIVPEFTIALQDSPEARRAGLDRFKDEVSSQLG